jgi:hypothetical protein
VFDLLLENILAKIPQITSVWSLCSDIAAFCGKVPIFSNLIRTLFAVSEG